VRRGEIWWADLPGPVGSRPAVILTRDAVLDRIEGVVVGLVTRTVRGLPAEVVLGRHQGVPTRCVANLDNVLTVPRHRLDRCMGTCGNVKLAELNAALKIAFDLP